jgi:hypothetical protein
MEDGGYVNLARISRGRECMRHFALQSGRREFLRFRSMSFVPIDRTLLIAGQAHSGF